MRISPFYSRGLPLLAFLSVACAQSRDILQNIVPVLPSSPSTAVPAPGPTVSASDVAEAIPVQLHWFDDGNLSAFPGYTFTGDRGCSPSALVSFLTIEQQIVPVEEEIHYSIRLQQQPSEAPTSVPTEVIYLDLESGGMVTGIPQLNWLQQTEEFNYTYISPGLVDLVKYRSNLQMLSSIINGLAYGQALNTSRYQCSSPNPELVPFVDYLNTLQGIVANASDINGGLKQGIEYRIGAGCIVEVDAYYAGQNLTTASVIASSNGTMPTVSDCCLACKAENNCNVFTFCPSFEGCRLGTSQVPSFTCELKLLANLTSNPIDLPAAIMRGPPTSFVSGRFG